MDYIDISSTMWYDVDRIHWIISDYDIMCQYWKNLKWKVLWQPFLHLPSSHLYTIDHRLIKCHGHINSLLPRYAPTYIKGCGTKSTEVLETLLESCPELYPHQHQKDASTSNRQEAFDDHTNDSIRRGLVGTAQSFRPNKEDNRNSHRLTSGSLICKKLKRRGALRRLSRKEAYLSQPSSADAGKVGQCAKVPSRRSSKPTGMTAVGHRTYPNMKWTPYKSDFYWGVILMSPMSKNVFRKEQGKATAVGLLRARKSSARKLRI